MSPCECGWGGELGGRLVLSFSPGERRPRKGVTPGPSCRPQGRSLLRGRRAPWGSEGRGRQGRGAGQGGGGPGGGGRGGGAGRAAAQRPRGPSRAGAGSGGPTERRGPAPVARGERARAPGPELGRLTSEPSRPPVKEGV